VLGYKKKKLERRLMAKKIKEVGDHEVKFFISDRDAYRILLEACAGCSPHYLTEVEKYDEDRNAEVSVFNDCPDCDVPSKLTGDIK